MCTPAASRIGLPQYTAPNMQPPCDYSELGRVAAEVGLAARWLRGMPVAAEPADYITYGWHCLHQA